MQRTIFSPWHGSPATTRAGSLIAAALLGLSAACSATIEDNKAGGGSQAGNENQTDGAGGSNNGTPGGGKSSSGGSGSGSGSGNNSSGPQGGQSQGNSGGNSGSQGGSGSGNNTGSGGMMMSGEPVPSALPAPNACTSNSPGPRLVRRLSAAEFNASIRDLFQDQTAPVAPVFNDQRVLGFSVDAKALVVQGLNADQLMNNAEAVAQWAVSKHLSQIASCNQLDSNCGKQWIKAFARKAFRTAIADNDPRIEAYNKLFLAETSFADGVTTVVTAMLQSPYFVYRTELGTGTSGTTTLTPYEVANSLSYLLTGSAPDNTLMQAADQVQSGGMQLSQMVDQQAQRLMSTQASQNAVMNFMSGWLGLDKLYSMVKDDNVYKLSDAQRDDMAGETRAFILDVFGSSGSVSNLFNANYSFLNQSLASYYGVSGSGMSTSFQKVTLDPSKRDGGLLAQASILTGYARADLSSPTQRGHLVRTRLLCQDVPPPPAGLDTKFQPAMTAKTTRDRYLQEHGSPSRPECYGCHRLMDPIGVAFEHYDSFGRYRTTENGITIDATGTIYQASQKDGDIAIDGLSGAKGLQQYLANSDELKRCLVRYWSYYAYGSASWSQDACTYDTVQKEASNNSYALKSVLMAIIHAPRFTQRVVE
ncbi:MAG: DUF1592 domain-containing protein [Myxococcota bacterium]